MKINKISVIIPTFNRNEMLGQCLKSLNNQLYDKDCFEIIVVDNTKDATAESFVSLFKRRTVNDIKYINETKQGLVYARHAGARAALYDILAFTDDDGILDKNWLVEINRVLNMNNEVSAIAGKIEIQWNGKTPDWIKKYESLLGRNDYGKEVFFDKGFHINGGNFIIKKDVLFKMKGFNPGQLGEYLAGDSETGLCKKLYDNNCLIGWAPNAVMFHCQDVNKNASEKDIGRRHFNNGIVEAFDSYSQAVLKPLWMLWDILKTVFNILKMSLIYVKKSRFFREKRRPEKFYIAYNKGKLSFYYKILTASAYRKMLNEKDWEL